MKKGLVKKEDENKFSSAPIVSSAHLASPEKGWQLSELEYAMTMVYNAFSRWMIHCMASVGFSDFKPLDILVLHNVNHRTKVKTSTDIAFMLNIDDSHHIDYSLQKLVKFGLIKGTKVGKDIFYLTTEKGKELCHNYRNIRQSCLIGAAIATDRNFEEVSHVALILRSISGLYDQASRSASSL